MYKLLLLFIYLMCLSYGLSEAYSNNPDLKNTGQYFTENEDSDHISTKRSETPNIIVMLVDDLGYGDLSGLGHPTSHTPNIDELASAGKFFTHFYVSSPVCSPSRASLLTGRYQVRSGVYPGAFESRSVSGLPQNETTIAELLKGKGYSTLISGKWHLGVGANGEFLPAYQGFDDYLGVPYSHDMCPCEVCYPGDKPCVGNCISIGNEVTCPLYSNTTIIEQPVYLPSLTQRLVDKSKNFITQNVEDGTPFFLYLSYLHVHYPQFASAKHEGTSIRGQMGDSLRELDDSVGQITKLLSDLNVHNNTLIWFTSDNGPAIGEARRGGSAGLLRCGKATTWEGGVRVPTFVTWPGQIEPARTHGLASALDILPTIASITATPVDLTLDGVDISSLLFENNSTSPREFFAVYGQTPEPSYEPMAVVWGRYKAHYYTRGSELSDPANYDPMCPNRHFLTQHDPPLLYDLYEDPGERYDISSSAEANDILSTMSAWRDSHRAEMTWMAPQTGIKDTSGQPCCTGSGCEPFPECCDCEASSTSFPARWTLNGIP